MAEFVPYEIAPAVRKLAERLFNPQRAAQVVQLLASTELPSSGRSCERVHLAILLICGSDFARFERELREAAKDWRDTLCAAGLENENWRDVLYAKGIDTSS
jgi:hypothetical protein